MQRLLRKFESAKSLVPAPIRRDAAEKSRFGVIYFGSTAPAMDEALEKLAGDGIGLDTLRVRGFPFDEEVEAFLCEHEFCFVVEQNRDAQFRSMLILETPVPKEKLRSVLVYSGFPLSSRHVVEEILEQCEAGPDLPGKHILAGQDLPHGD